MKIKDLQKEERPRERVLKYGSTTLSNAEILALVLGQGSRKENAVELGQYILQKYNLRILSRLSISHLKKIRGIGTAKACQLIASFELGRRIAVSTKEKKKKIATPKQVAKLFLPEMSTLQKECCKGVYIDARKRIIKEETIFVGTLNQSLIHPREIFEIAIREGAAGVVLVHNHPSGDPKPSHEDILITKQLKDAGAILGIPFLDHIIIGDNSYYSLKEKGYL